MSVQLKSGSFARGIEVWRPDPEGMLQCTAGAYQEMPQFAACSQRLSFAEGQGLPGLAWSHRAPMVMHNLQTEQFLRSEAASAEGLDCGVALPCFRGGELRGVVVLLMERSEDARGAVEIWRPNDRRELGLSESYYNNLESFARLSQFVKFPCGAGLPGQIWQTRCPKVIGDLGASPAFVRGNGARADGLNVALGIPFMRSPWDLESVVLLMTAEDSPFARNIEVWLRDERGELHLHSLGEANGNDAAAHLPRGQAVAEAVWREEAPLVFPNAAEVEYAADFEFAAGVPVFVGDTLVAAVTMLA